MTAEPALDRALSTFDVRPGRAVQRALAAHERLNLPRGGAALVYVRAGEISGRTTSHGACTVDVASGSAAMTGERTLLAGDALVSLGCYGLALVSHSGAELTVVPLQVAPSPQTRSLPPFVFVSGFSRVEPAAAALAAHLGSVPPGSVADRQGDETICKLMVTTVLLSALRAWAAADDAAWPPRTDDPFLSRVVAAIADDPGHDWSIGELASIGAMSRSVFAERFRRTFGSSPAAYVTAVRMERAKELLEAGTPVAELSNMLGYASDGGFSRAFRRHTGVAPSAWRTGRGSTLVV
ncbi:helix-turn-helix transcriptional regulator [Microbacterium trichothecenolyticum]|uniref:AraC-like DNA-binding protein n=1 Tax=Microbacterium trichothecenolyticum TaxID=69370 RepID=A0ABU0TVZ3_MICTR|nr:AraC family transcriptional regulator [Microbacterium trichothecenolyticum]MDQ1123830.1 AraC-like DNA-binding protein [Microbacterium trichothecenolyticum]